MLTNQIWYHKIKPQKHIRIVGIKSAGLGGVRMGTKGALRAVQAKEPLSAQEMHTLLELIKSVKYGSITLIIQDGVVIQLDKNEKIRLR